MTTPLPPDAVHDALTTIYPVTTTGRHATILPPPSDDPADLVAPIPAPPRDPRYPSATNPCVWPGWSLDEHDPLDDAEETL